MSKNNLNKNIQKLMDLNINNFNSNFSIFETNKSEVLSIKKHKIDIYNKWSFLIQFKDKTQNWIKDEDCECELMISKYLEKIKKNTVYFFCRVSTKEQDGCTNVSLKSQENELHKNIYLYKDKYRIRTYKITNSAYKDIPTVLKRIGEACIPGDIIMTYNIDRLSRNIIKYLAWLEELTENKITIFALMENISYNNEKLKFIQAILDAHIESDKISKRIKMSYQHKIERGDEAVGYLKYGKKYHHIVQNGKTVRKVVKDNENEQKVIKLIKKMKNNSNEYVSKYLNQHGYTKRGRVWSPNMINYIKKDF